MTVSAAAILAALLSLAPHRLDATELPEAREARLRPYAEGIAAAARTPLEVSVLLAQADHETRFASYVLEGRCHEGPVGERCDNGLSRGAWQVRAWCRATDPAGEAACVLRQFRYGVSKCGSLEGGFAALAGASCGWSGAPARVRTVRRWSAVVAKAGGGR